LASKGAQSGHRLCQVPSANNAEVHRRTRTNPTTTKPQPNIRDPVLCWTLLPFASASTVSAPPSACGSVAERFCCGGAQALQQTGSQLRQGEGKAITALWGQPPANSPHCKTGPEQRVWVGVERKTRAETKLRNAVRSRQCMGLRYPGSKGGGVEAGQGNEYTGGEAKARTRIRQPPLRTRPPTGLRPM
jgi:hypothetical protein